MVVPNCLHGRHDSAHLEDGKCMYHFTPLAQCTVGDPVLILTVFDVPTCNRPLPLTRPLLANWHENKHRTSLIHTYLTFMLNFSLVRQKLWLPKSRQFLWNDQPTDRSAAKNDVMVISFPTGVLFSIRLAELQHGFPLIHL